MRLAATALAVLAVSGMAQWLIFLSLDLWVSPWWAIAVVSVGIAVGVLTGTPGGLATTEAAMIAAYVALGIDEVSATAATLLFRGLHYAVVLVLGLPALLVLELGGIEPLRTGDPPAAGAPPTDARPGT